jgi:hypothetical protein
VTKIICSIPGLDRLVDGVLDQRPVDDRQHLLGQRLGGGKKAGAKAAHRKHCLAQRLDRHRILLGDADSGRWSGSKSLARFRARQLAALRSPVSNWTGRKVQPSNR